jgi:hypothetical protein
MAGVLRVPRTRGALSGVLLILLGLWGGLIPFVGPYFHFSYSPGTAWTYTQGRLWLEILPAAGTVLGGLILLASRVRPVAMFGAWLAAASGAWFVVGQLLTPLWHSTGVMALGTPLGGTVTRVLVQLSYLTGLGVVIVFVAALSIGRLSVIGIRDARLAAREEVVPETAGSAEAVADGDAVTTARLSRRFPGRADKASAGASPADTAPADTAPADTASADRTPADRTPADRTPADRTPADTAPAETAPAETVPAGSRAAREDTAVSGTRTPPAS